MMIDVNQAIGVLSLMAAAGFFYNIKSDIKVSRTEQENDRRRFAGGIKSLKAEFSKMDQNLNHNGFLTKADLDRLLTDSFRRYEDLATRVAGFERKVDLIDDGMTKRHHDLRNELQGTLTQMRNDIEQIKVLVAGELGRRQGTPQLEDQMKQLLEELRKAR